MPDHTRIRPASQRPSPGPGAGAAAAAHHEPVPDDDPPARAVLALDPPGEHLERRGGHLPHVGAHRRHRRGGVGGERHVVPADDGDVARHGQPRVVKRSQRPEGQQVAGAEQGVEPRAAGQVPLQRLGDPDEFAALVVYLASPLSDFMTGAVIALDGARDNWRGKYPPEWMAPEERRR